jgi:hypothetical protein
MIEKRGCGAKIAAMVIIFFLLSISASYAMDELALKGIVRSINFGSNVVTIDVKSKSCPGVQNFTFDSSAGLDSGMIGKRVTIKIDASKCGKGATPKIMKITK